MYKSDCISSFGTERTSACSNSLCTGKTTCASAPFFAVFFCGGENILLLFSFQLIDCKKCLKILNLSEFDSLQVTISPLNIPFLEILLMTFLLILTNSWWFSLIQFFASTLTDRFLRFAFINIIIILPLAAIPHPCPRLTTVFLSASFPDSFSL